MEAPSCLIFDLGNVLSFFDHRIACRRLAEMSSAGLGEAEVYARIFESGLSRRYELGHVSSEAFLAALAQQLDIDPRLEGLAAAWSDIFWPNETVMALIPRLYAASYRLLIGSNTNELHYLHESRTGLREILPCFHAAILSHEVGALKPSADFYTRCFETAGCPPSSCLYIDDRDDLVQAAAQLGLPGITYTPKVDLVAELRVRGVEV